MKFRKYIFVFFIFVFHTPFVYAHEIRPASLIIKENTETKINHYQTYNAIWKVPYRDGLVLDINPIFESSIIVNQVGSPYNDGGFVFQTFDIQANTPLHETSLSIQNLEKTLVDVIVSIHYNNGDEATAIINPTNNQLLLPRKNTLFSIISSYTILGVEHILLGYDHLFFVLALFLLSTSLSVLLKTITAFTIAHSITLVLTVLGIISLPPAPVEAVIALSIVFLAVEIINYTQGKLTLSIQKPWWVAGTFGLLHGLGFAGALAEIGLPKINLSYALAFFNIGVEIGQIIFLLVAIFITYQFTKTNIFSQFANKKIAAYFIGTIASYWLIERLYGIII